jgi:alanyl-tRNA synthetase
MTSDQIREMYLRFFEGKGHKRVPSSPLIPHEDPTLLLTSAGMVQFKAYFMGERPAPSPRLTSCQKCFRTTDIESVGNSKHLTFFEMLGNFSIGDYFKQEAIEYAWEFVIEHLGLPRERLWITIFLDDDESFDYWRQLGVPEERIIRHGEDDNFWGPAGDSGPCGPCSEIHYDFGEEVGCGLPTCVPGCDCERFLEIWNLVFTQYYQDESGSRTPLPRNNVDTGMGLERTVAVVQGKRSFYETDLFVPIINKVAELAGVKYGADEKTDRAIRVIAEHGRAVAFLIADGVLPSNEGRGYVLRRVLRRAVRFGRLLGLVEPFLAEVAKAAIAKMGHVYPELVQNQDFSLRVIELEEERFGETLRIGSPILEEGIIPLRIEAVRAVVDIRQGLQGFAAQAARTRTDHGFSARVKLMVYGLLEPLEGRLAEEATSLNLSSATALGRLMAVMPMSESIKRVKDSLLKATRENLVEVLDRGIEELAYSIRTISGQEVFELYDTYGFPKELTAEIAAENGLSVDLEGFEREMEQQRERARAAQVIKTSGIPSEEAVGTPTITASSPQSTRFVGDKTLKHQSKILILLPKSQWPETTVEAVSQGQYVGVILRETPFYGEMGGQVGDTGEIRGPEGRLQVSNTIRLTANGHELIVHQGKVVEGSLHVQDLVEAEVDAERRLDIARNHTATHLLHNALRQVLGSHVRQMGSLVAPDRLRFDFSHYASVSEEELETIQQLINEKIRRDLVVESEMMPFDQAVAGGAIALFGEKYGDTVRVMSIKAPDESGALSVELCGGSHVSRTGEIGFCQIVSESSIGAGLRRIEAVTGRGAEAYIAQRFSTLERIAQQLQTPAAEVEGKVTNILAELESQRKRAAALQRELSRIEAKQYVDKHRIVDGIPVNTAQVSAPNMEELRQICEWLRDQQGGGVVVLGADFNNRANFVAMGTPDLVAKGFHAGKLVNEVAAVAGGRGGGSAVLGQGGGKDRNKIGEALKLVDELIKKSSDR